MQKTAAVTIRLTDSLKNRLASRARRQHRSLSAQLVHDLEAVVNEAPEQAAGGRFLGLFAGSRIPTDRDIRDVRVLLWGRLARRRDRRG